MVDQALNALAARVKDCYIRERSRWESIKVGSPVAYHPPNDYDGAEPLLLGGEVVMKPGRKSEWLKLADWCERHKIDPETYVTVVFTNLRITRKRAPEPNQITKGFYLDLWDDNIPKLSERIRVELVTQTSIAEGRWARIRLSYEDVTSLEAWAEVLCDVNLSLSPLFRYCIAKRIGGKRFNKIARRFEVQAMLGFMRFRAWYEKHWAAILPTGFGDEAAQQRPYLAIEANEV